jgi:hypothetical protein
LKLREQAEKCRRLAGHTVDANTVEQLLRIAQELEAEAAAINARKQELRINRMIQKLALAELKDTAARAKEAVARAREAEQRAKDKKQPD